MSHTYPCDTCGEERGAGYPHPCDMAEVIDGLRSRLSELESAPRFAILYEAVYYFDPQTCGVRASTVCFSLDEESAKVAAAAYRPYHYDMQNRMVISSGVVPRLAVHVEGDTYSIVTLGHTVTLTKDGSKA